MSFLTELFAEERFDLACQFEALRRELVAQRPSTRSNAGTALSVEEVCAWLGCKERQVFNLLKSGDLERAPRLGRSLRVTRASVERVMQPKATKARKRPARAFEPARLEDIPIFKR